MSHMYQIQDMSYRIKEANVALVHGMGYRHACAGAACNHMSDMYQRAPDAKARKQVLGARAD